VQFFPWLQGCYTLLPSACFFLLLVALLNIKRQTVHTCFFGEQKTLFYFGGPLFPR
jgi:hypothetical protein